MDGTGWEDIRRALDDLDFPATKEDVVAHAERYGGSPAAVQLLRAMPRNTYRSMAELRQSVPLEPAAEKGQTADRKARQARSRHSQRIAQHLRDPEE